MKTDKPQERVQKIISASGFCSRRKAEEYIISGAVKVNGHTVKIGDTASAVDVISVNGEKLNKNKKKFHYVKLHKPRGYITTLTDTHGRKTIADLIRHIPERLYPVGRLDKNSEGLLILTNDGEFAHALSHPSNKIKKVYRVTVPAVVSNEILTAMMKGVDIGEDGETEYTNPCEIKILTENANDKTNENAGKIRTVLEFTLTQGKKRQIRRMCKKTGLPVSRLRRISIGGVKLGMLKPAHSENLTDEELALLHGKINVKEKFHK